VVLAGSKDLAGCLPACLYQQITLPLSGIGFGFCYFMVPQSVPAASLTRQNQLSSVGEDTVAMCGWQDAARTAAAVPSSAVDCYRCLNKYLSVSRVST